MDHMLLDQRFIKSLHHFRIVERCHSQDVRHVISSGEIVSINSQHLDLNHAKGEWRHWIPSTCQYLTYLTWNSKQPVFKWLVQLDSISIHENLFFLQTSIKNGFFGRISEEWLRMLAMKLPEKEAIQILQDSHCLRDLLRKDHHALQHELSKRSQPLHFFEDQVWCGNCCN